MLGYAQQTEASPDLWELGEITERPVLGFVEQRSEMLDGEGAILPRYRTTTSISLLSHGVEKSEYGDLIYVTYKGRKWVPATIVHEPPEIVIYIGEEYNGPTEG